MAAQGMTRLHITPFNPSLYNNIIPPSLQPVARNPSYHTIATDPARNYGYIDLPVQDAEKLRNKLNGSVLKGVKMRIDAARPDKRKRILDEIETAKQQEQKGQQEQKQPSSKRAKRAAKAKPAKGSHGEEMPGFVLPDKRSVKRGWTEDPALSRTRAIRDREEKDKKEQQKRKKQDKSKFIAGPELLFKTTLPPAAAAIAADDAKRTNKDKKEKKLKGALQGPPRHVPVVLHEFEKTTQYPSFLRSAKLDGAAGNGVAAVYVQGQGWLDHDGNLVEEVPDRPKREDRLNALPENRLCPVAFDHGHDYAYHQKAYLGEERQEKGQNQEKEQIPSAAEQDESPADSPAQDEKTREQLARFDQMLAEEGSDSDEVFDDAKSDAASSVNRAEEEPEDEDDVDDADDVALDDVADDVDMDDSGDDADDAVDADDANVDAGDAPRDDSEDDSEDHDQTAPENEAQNDTQDAAQDGKHEQPKTHNDHVEDQIMLDHTPEVDTERAHVEPYHTTSEPASAEGSDSAEEDSADEDSADEDSADQDSAHQDSADEDSDDSSKDQAISQNTKHRTTPPIQEDAAKQVHPLEALFKPEMPDGTPKPAPIQTSFSFFGADNMSDVADNENLGEPQTPFTSQDLRYRGTRSAAPTPDTAAIGKRFSFSFANNYADQEEEEEEYDDHLTAINHHSYALGDEDADFAEYQEPAANADQGETDFSKWFWENRGDTNRAWKKRRRDVMKVKRQRENRRLTRRIV